MLNEQAKARSALASARNALLEAGVTLQTKGTELSERLEQRNQQTQLRHQANLEAILYLALKNCSANASDHPLDADWLESFLALAERTSNPEMQKLWALIFAKEASIRGSFSVRSLNSLSQLTRKDADMFQRAVSLSSLTAGDGSRKILVGCYHDKRWGLFDKNKQHHLSLNQFGLPYSSLLWLMEHNLIHSTELETSCLPKGQQSSLKIAAKTIHFTPRVEVLKLRYYRFTPVGDELAQLLSGREQSDYQSALLSMLAQTSQLNQP